MAHRARPARRAPLPDRQRLVAARRRESQFDQQPIEATALLLAAEAAHRRDRRRALSGGDGAGVRLVPRRQRPRRRRRRSGAGRVPRRPDRGRRQHEPGGRVDADVADRRRAHPGSGPRARSSAPPAVAPVGTELSRDVGAARDAGPRRRSFGARREPDPDRRRRPVSGELGLQSRRGSGRRRDDPAGAGRGPARHLPAPRRPQRRRRDATGGSIPSRSSVPTSSATPRRSGAARTRA